MRADAIRVIKASLIIVIAVSVVVVGLAESRLVYQILDKVSYPVLSNNLFVEVKSNFHEVRGLTPPPTVKLNVVNLKWVEENWGRRNLDYDPQLQVDEDIYKALLMIPDDLSLIDVRRQQTLSILAASSGGEIYIVADYFDPVDKVEASKILAHELTHVIQGHYFPSNSPSTYDASQAWTSLIEGDASFTADRYTKHFTLSQGYRSSGDSTTLPSSIIELWLFPYRYGNSFIAYLHSVGGWNLIDETYRNPPTTTEQVMHPDKYLTRESFRNLTSPLFMEEYDIIRTDRLGEHFIKTFLSTYLDPKESEVASEGWNGDNFTYYAGDGESIFYWSIAWDTYKDQQEFHQTIKKLMATVGATPLEQENGYQRWRRDWRYIHLKEKRGNVTQFIISSTSLFSSPQEDYRSIRSKDLHRGSIIFQGVKFILYGGGTKSVVSLPFPIFH